MTTIATWCILIAVVFVGSWFLLAEKPEPEPEVVIPVEDHRFDGGWHDSERCQYIYDGASDFTADLPCGLAAWQHAGGVVEEQDWFDVDEDDMCEGHPTVTGGLSDCGLPVGHGAVPEMDEPETQVTDHVYYDDGTGDCAAEDCGQYREQHTLPGVIYLIEWDEER